MQKTLPEETVVGFGPKVIRFFTTNRSFITIWIALFIAIIGIAMVSPLMPVFAREMGATGIWLGLAFSGFTISQIPAMPLVGKLSDRFNKKVFLWVGLLIYSIAAAGYYWAPGYQELVFFRIFSGIGAAMVVPVAFSYIGEMAPRGYEGRYMGLFSIALISGFGAGPILGGVIHDTLGTDAVFISMSVMALVGLVIILLFLPQKVTPARSADSPEKAESGEPSTSFILMLGDNTIRGIVSLQLVFGVLFGTVLAFIGIWITTVIGASVSYVGIILSVRSIMNGIVAYPFGWLADRVNRVSLITLGMGTVVIGTFSIPWINSTALLLGLFAVMGLFESMSMPSLNAITVEKGRIVGMGSVMGIFNMSMSLGLVIGSIVGGIIATALGLAAVFRMAALLGLVGLVIFNVFMRRNKSLPESVPDIS
ncbi:MFS transporter, partial [Chloroflexota bacterium]